MNEPDLDLFEQELRALRPAAPPCELMDRLANAGLEGFLTTDKHGLTRMGTEAGRSRASVNALREEITDARGLRRLRPEALNPCSYVFIRALNSIGHSWRFLLRLLVPVGGLALAVVLAWPVIMNQSQPEAAPQAATPTPVLKPDSVKVDEQLMGTFDAVGRLPDGEAVRFRYQKWMDQVIVKDKASGVVIEQRTPRVEVIPVGFETY